VGSLLKEARHPDWVDHAIMETAHAWVAAIDLAHEGLVRWHPIEALQDFFAGCGCPLLGDAEEEAPMTSDWLARRIRVSTPSEPRHFGPGTLFPLDDVLGYLAGAMGAGRAHIIMADNGSGWPGAGRTTVGIRGKPDVPSARATRMASWREVACGACNGLEVSRFR